MAKWDENFDSHRLAGPAFTKQMLHREKFGHDKDNDAFGLVVGRFRDQPMIWYSGGDLDSSTFMARLPQLRLAVICLSNMPMGNERRRRRRRCWRFCWAPSECGSAIPYRLFARATLARGGGSIGSRVSDLISFSTTLERTCVTPGSLNATSCRKRS